MPLSPSDATTALREILLHARSAERLRLDRIARAVNPLHGHRALDPYTLPTTVELPRGANPTMRNLAVKARTNYLPLILDVLTNTLIVEGYQPPDGQENAPAWAGWQANGWDARQGGVHRGALQYGVSYAMVLPGEPGPVMRAVSPRKLTALYADAVEDDWPLLALREYDDGYRLLDEEAVYFFGREKGAAPRYVERREHGLGVCPVVRFRDQMLLDEDDQLGIIEPLMSIQQRVEETTYGMLVAQYYSAFRQRYVIGWVPDSEQEQLKASAGDFWAFKDGPDQVKVGEFEGTDPTRYIDAKNSAVADMAAISQVPPQQLALGGGLSNLSAEALASLEAGKDRKVRSIETSLGESHEQMLRLYDYAAGNTTSLDNDAASVRWVNATARSLAQTVDALGKMVQMLGVPAQAAWEDIPGMDDAKLNRWKGLAREGDAMAQLAGLLEDQAAEPL